MKTNTKAKRTKVPEFDIDRRTAGGSGAVGSKLTVHQELERTVLTCLLWEDLYYENGENVVQRIKRLVAESDPSFCAALAVKARNQYKLRHVPLLIAREMARHDFSKRFVADTLVEVIQRPDEITELLSLYWQDRDGEKKKLAHCIKNGIARAFPKFDEYQLKKYAGENNAIKLRDALFLTRPISTTFEQEELWKRLASRELKSADTWENELSNSKDKKASWIRLIEERKLGGLAFLRNLRNMIKAEVPNDIIRKGLKNVNVEKVLPFRFITAARYAPQFEAELEQLMFRCLENQPKIPGKTVFCVDISGSMGGTLSRNSELNRLDTACALGILIREICEEPVIYATAGCDSKRVHATDIVPARRGFALIEAIKGMGSKLGGGGIFLKPVMDYLYKQEKEADTVILITDEQDTSGDKYDPSQAKAFGKRNFIINISSEKNGVAYNKFSHINGWSEAVLDYIRLVQ